MPQGALGYIGVVPVDKGAIRQVVEYDHTIAARGTANTATETVLRKVLKGSGAGIDPLQIDLIEVIPAGDITGHGSNYVTFNVYNRKSDGSGTDVIATLALTDTTSGAYGKYKALKLTLDPTKAPPKVDDVLTFEVAVASGGQTTPQMAVRTRFRA